jgi:hypothetical protein
MKIGEKVWVLCEVVSEPDGNGVHVSHRGAGWYADLSACKPVEPEAIKKGDSIPFKIGDRVVTSHGRKGVVEHINLIEGFPVTVRQSVRELVSYRVSQVKLDAEPLCDDHCIGNVCDLFEPTGVACPNDSCDIETGVRNAPVKQYLTGENQPANDSDYRAATPKDVSRVVCGGKVKARFRDHKSDEWTKTDEWLGGYDSTEESKWIDDTGCPWKYCQVYDPEKPQHEPDNPARHLPAWFGKGLRYLAAMSDATVVEVLNNQTKKGLNLLSDFDTVETGDLFQSSRDGKFHRCNFTVGMPVLEAVLRGHQQREGWTFYRPKKVQA